MGVSIYRIKKWYKMLTHQSIYHVSQGVGRHYSKHTVAGYYNDLTEKVTKDDPDILVPQYHTEKGDLRYFSIGIFQYGLAAYDLYLEHHAENFKEKFFACVSWAMEHQEPEGGWKTFDHEDPEHPYSSMAQGEGASLLLRAHTVTGQADYLEAARKAIYFMLRPLDEGGTALYEEDALFLFEFTTKPLVLNGWIFSLWGLYDYCKCVDDAFAKDQLVRTLLGLKNKLPEYDVKYWSRYDVETRISSPFYHRLHIAQLTVMYDLFGDEIYKEYADRWERYLHSFWKPKRAFIKKAWQKIFEK